MYRVRRLRDPHWLVVEAEWLEVYGITRRHVQEVARAAIAAELDVDPDAFDVEI